MEPVRRKDNSGNTLPRTAAAILICCLSTPVAAETVASYGACLDLVERDPREAITAAEAWWSRDRQPAARHCAALAMIRIGDYERAALALEALADAQTEDQPDRRAALLAQAGNAWLLDDRPARARRSFTDALADRPKDVELRIDRARAAAAAGDYRAAVDDLDLALASDPDHVPAYLFRASARRQLGQYGLARADLDRILVAEPEHPEARLERGTVRLLSGDADGARTDWRRILRTAPGTPQAKPASTNLDKLRESGKP